MDRHISIRRGISFLILAAVVIATTASAGNGRWLPVGPIWGGGLANITIDPSNHRILYATCGRVARNGGPGVLESTDQGDSWSLILSLPESIALTAGPAGTSTLYAGSIGDGVWKSTDGGKTWQISSNGLPPGTDGNTWGYIEALAADPVNSGVVYASVYADGMYKTIDGGAHWTAINNGLTLAQGPVVVITVDPAKPQTIYAGSSLTSFSTDSIYRSTDGGGSWSAVGPATALGAEQITIDPNNHEKVYAADIASGLYVSSDSGADWTAIVSPLGAAEAVSVQVDPSNSQHLWAGSLLDGLYESSDGGNHWTQNSEETTGTVLDIVPDPVNAAIVYAAPPLGLLKSRNGGKTWYNLQNGIPVPDINQVAAVKGGAIYIGTAVDGIFKGTEHGSNWIALSNSPNFNGYFFPIYSLVQDPVNADTLYTAAGYGVFKTTDGGANWTQLNNGLTDPTIAQFLTVAVDPHDSNVVYVGTNGGSSFYKSTDGGASWQASSSGMVSPYAVEVDAIAVDPADSNTIYAGTTFVGLFKSTDAGATWDRDVEPIGGVSDVSFDPENHNTIYLVGGLGVYRSVDGGNTWSAIMNGLPLGFGGSSIQVDLKDSSVLYLAQSYYGAYISLDAGAHWQPMDQWQRLNAKQPPGIPTPLRVVALDLDPGTDQVYGIGSNSWLYTFRQPGGWNLR